MTRLMQAVAVMIAALALLGAGLAHAAPARRAHPVPAHAWNTTVRATPSGSHMIGNPAAKVRLIEYVSYTCPHCAHFNETTQGPLQGGYVRTGKVLVEVRNLVRDPVDLTVALLTNCGDPARFVANHNLFLATQERWAALLTNSTDEQRQRWNAGALPVRLKTIANDFGFYPMMASRGYARGQVDACLADPAMLKRLVATTDEAGKAGVNSTPSFLVNGTLVDAHAWESLEPLIKAAL